MVSTDPAHSLGDVLDLPLGSEPRPVPGGPRLLAAELAAEPAWRRWLGARRAALRTLAERGTVLDASEVERLLDLRLPGVDELVGLIELVRLARESGSTRVIVDTAPTAHTLRLLEMPEALERFAAVLLAFEARHEEVARSLTGGFRPDEADRLAGAVGAEAREIGRLIRDPERARFVWVLLPETLSLAETRDALARLAGTGVAVEQLVVNRLAPDSTSEDPARTREACAECAARRRSEAQVLDEIRRELPALPVRTVAELDAEPRGREALLALGASLVEPQRPLPKAPGEPAPEASGTGRRPVPSGRAPGPPTWLGELAPPGTRLLLFGGKGGVGKTTCAAAVALLLARFGSGSGSGSGPGSGLGPPRPVSVLSTDPAHSLGDVLETELGDDDERPVPGAVGGLRARELDAGRRFAAHHERFRDALERGFGGFGRGSSGFDAPFDREVLERLLAATPPGLDELVAMSELLDAVPGSEAPGEPADRLLVVDTAPTGHALRLLEMPELALEWDHALLSLLLEYRRAVGLGDLAQDLLALAGSLKRLRALLADPVRCRFVAVTRAGELPTRETERLLARLGELGIHVPAVVVNAVPGGSCRRCREAARHARPGRERLERGGRCTILSAPAEYPPPRGAAALERWALSWGGAKPT